MTAAAESLAGAQGAGGAAGEGQGAAAFDWGKHVTDADDLGWVQNKKYDGPGAVAKAARGLEKLLGGPREKLIRLPDSDDSPEWKDIHSKLGRPEKAEEYGIAGADPELLAKVHEAGLSKRQVGVLAAYLTERGQASTAQADAQYAQQAEADDTALKTEWGGAYDENLKIAGQLAQKVRAGLGMDEAQWNDVATKLTRSVGVATAVKMFAFLGRGLGEHKFLGGEKDDGGFGTTPAVARAQLEALRGNPEQIKAKMSDIKSVRMAAVAKEMALQEIIDSGA